ncbi:MAG: alpha/beta hydrolase-fold protein [Terracidiphilus sp.]|jgi:enterochelin esterase family protein
MARPSILLTSAVRTVIICLASANVLPAICLHAQQQEHKTQIPQLNIPAPTPNDNLKSVEVLADRQVRFRIWAPSAIEVKLNAEGPETTPGMTPEDLKTFNAGIAMHKGDLGIWEMTIGPIKPGVYLYNFIVDGVSAADPRNPISAQTLNQPRSIYEVPGAVFSEYTPEVLHGVIGVVYYNSKATGGLRRMHIYTPPGYENGAERLPVLYLLHGAGGTDNSWSVTGRAGAILDNLIAAHKAVPMIVVMPAGHISRDFRMGSGSGSIGHDVFNKDLVEDIMPYVDSHYRTFTDRDHRALAGLSMGGMQTLAVSLRDSADFGWVGVFSSGWLPNALKEAEEVDLAQYHDSGKPFHLYWFAIGQHDFLLNNCHETVAMLNKAGINTIMHESDGYHTWSNWRDYLNLFAPMLFQTAPAQK